MHRLAPFEIEHRDHANHRWSARPTAGHRITADEGRGEREGWRRAMLSSR
jgi:hypothetical protein